MVRRAAAAMVRKVEAAKEELFQCLRRIHERRKTHAQEGKLLDEDEARCYAAYDALQRELADFLGKQIRKGK